MLTEKQIQEARKKYGIEVPTQKGLNGVQPQQNGAFKALNAVGSLAGLDVLGKKIGGNIAKAIPIPKVIAPVNYQGTQEQFQKEQQGQYRQDISKEMPTTGQTLGAAGKLGLTLGTLGAGSAATGLG